MEKFQNTIANTVDTAKLRSVDFLKHLPPQHDADKMSFPVIFNTRAALGQADSAPLLDEQGREVPGVRILVCDMGGKINLNTGRCSLRGLATLSHDQRVIFISACESAPSP